MTDSAEKKLPDWLSCYSNTEVTNLPWYYSQLDPDLFDFLAKQNVVGGTFLDLGTGSGSQAVELARRGFDVMGTDVSPRAIELAKDLAEKEDVECEFLVDNILNTYLPRGRFDYVFDRGCFHILPPAERIKYINNIGHITKRRGVLFLKCFSSEEPRSEGPYRFSPDEIRKLFGPIFELTRVENTRVARRNSTTLNERLEL